MPPRRAWPPRRPPKPPARRPPARHPRKLSAADGTWRFLRRTRPGRAGRTRGRGRGAPARAQLVMTTAAPVTESAAAVGASVTTCEVPAMVAVPVPMELPPVSRSVTDSFWPLQPAAMPLTVAPVVLYLPDAVSYV